MSSPLPIELHHGDYRDALAGVKADLIFTSPPYNIGSRGLAKRGDNTKRPGYEHRKGNYGRGIKLWGSITGYPDDLPEAEYQESQVEFLVWAAEHIVADGTVVYNHKEHHRAKTAIHPLEWILHPEVKARLTLVQTIIWDRGTPHNLEPTYFWPYHELLFVLRHAAGSYREPRHERLPMFRPNVWHVPPAAALPGAKKHNAEFPVAIAETVVSLWSEPGQLVCDPYMGRATTALAARNLGRRFAGAEVQENYFRLAQDRLAAPTDLFGRAP